MHFRVRATATRIHGAESSFMSSDLTAWLFHPPYPPWNIRYEKECRRSGIYTHAMMNGQRYFVGEKLTINFYDDHHRCDISSKFSFSLVLDRRVNNVIEIRSINV